MIVPSDVWVRYPWCETCPTPRNGPSLQPKPSSLGRSCARLGGDPLPTCRVQRRTSNKQLAGSWSCTARLRRVVSRRGRGIGIPCTEPARRAFDTPAAGPRAAAAAAALQASGVTCTPVGVGTS
eukprot:17770-Chlamydomonas_euryale.AAC.2